MDGLPRIIYLADEFRIPIPKKLLPFVPQGILVQGIAEQGINNAVLDKKLPREQLIHLAEKGSYNGKQEKDRGSPEEYRFLIGQEVIEELEIQREELSLTEYLNLMRSTHDFVNFGGDELVATLEVDLSEAPEGIPLAKFPSGFEPLDIVSGGLYQGIITLIGRTGHGKTSFMLTLMEALRATTDMELWFFEVEIPMQMMLWRTQALRQRVKFRPGDKLRTGSFTARDILDDILRHPNPNRAIFIDGPDAMSVASGDEKRFAIEDVYRDLLRIKENSKLVVVSSQARRKDGAQITMESVAEAWLKVWYSDMVVGLQKMQRSPRGGPGVNRYRINVVKNRFGVEGREIEFDYNLANLDWDLTTMDLREFETEEEW